MNNLIGIQNFFLVLAEFNRTLGKTPFTRKVKLTPPKLRIVQITV